MREDPRLAQIRAALHEHPEWFASDWARRRVTALLGAAPVAAAQPPDGWFYFGSHVDYGGPLELSADVDESGLPLWERHPVGGVTPPQGIDRGRVHGLMCNVYAGVTSPSAAVDAVLALVRPVEGSVLTPGDVVIVLKWHDHGTLGSPDEEALASRLEAGA